MKFLIIETSTSQSFIALSKEEGLFVELLPPLKQSQTLLPTIEKLLKNETIDAIAVGTGPGSFTGTRVGVIAAKGLAFSMGLPLTPFCSLKIFTPDSNGPFTLVGDAKSRGAILLKGIRNEDTVTFEAPLLGKKTPLSKTLNLPFLASYLKKKFLLEGGTSHHQVHVAYL